MAQRDVRDRGSYLAGLDALARKVLAADDPYDVGLRLMGYLTDYLELESSAGVLYRIWGVLTDGVDGPRANEPGVAESARQAMKRAAAEWLDLSKDDKGVVQTG